MKKVFGVLAVAMLSYGLIPAQEGTLVVAGLMRDTTVHAALDAAKRLEPQTLEDQIRFCETAASGFKEAKRADLLRQSFEALGLENVRVDRAGNVLGTRPGLELHPHLVLAAHLDTVFPDGTDVKVLRDGPLLKAPGVSDNARGLAVMVGVIRALQQARITTQGSITFVADVGEEGLGDLRGVRQLLQETLRGTVDSFVSIDGSGAGIIHIAVGSRRFRVTYKGPGGHSYASFGLANPIHALGRVIAKIAEFEVPREPRTTFNVGRIGGGTSINSIASEAWMEMDMRSSDLRSLAALDAQFHAAVDRALADENERWQDRGRLSATVNLVGERPGGQTPKSAAIVQTALAVSESLGIAGSLGEGSTDANIPISMRIPAITIGGGGRSSGSHSLEELFDSSDSWHGTQRATLLAIALTRK